MTKTSIKDFGKKVIIVLCVLVISGFGMIIKPVNAYAEILNGNKAPYGGHMHNCDPKVRTQIKVSDLKEPNQDFKGNVDHTKYKDNDSHYVYDSQLMIKDFRDKGKFFHISHKNESGFFILDANDFHYYITVENPDGTPLAKYTMLASDCADAFSQDLVLDCEMAGEDVDSKLRVDFGEKDTLRKIVANPSEYDGVVVYVDRVWIED